MQHVKASTKRGQELLARAKYVKGKTLDDVYKTYSAEKRNAFNDWWFFCKQNDMRNLHICASSSSFFSLSFEDDEHVYYITFANNYCIDLNA